MSCVESKAMDEIGVKCVSEHGKARCCESWKWFGLWIVLVVDWSVVGGSM